MPADAFYEFYDIMDCLNVFRCGLCFSDLAVENKHITINDDYQGAEAIPEFNYVSINGVEEDKESLKLSIYKAA